MKVESKKPVTLRLTYNEKKVKVGVYFPATNTLEVKKKKSEDYDLESKSWALEEKLVNFILDKHCTVVLKDLDTKWEYKANIDDFKVYGSIYSPKDALAQIRLPIDYWEVTRAKDRSHVIKCSELTCRHCFVYNCLRGTISINEDGRCANYEEKAT